MQGSKTHLQDILREDCVAAVLYDICGEKAESEGYPTVAATLKQMSLYKREHARLWLKALGMLGDTPTNLEKLLHITGRERFKRYAAQEKDKTLAVQFHEVAQCEGEMEAMLLGQLAQVQLQQVSAGQSTHGRCCRCGYPWDGEKPPQVCPVCQQIRSFVGK